MAAAVTSRLTEPEWPIARRFAIHRLPAAVRCLIKHNWGRVSHFNKRGLTLSIARANPCEADESPSHAAAPVLSALPAMNVTAPPPPAPAEVAVEESAARHEPPPEEDPPAGNAAKSPNKPPKGPNGGKNCNPLVSNHLEQPDNPGPGMCVSFYG